MSGQSSQVAAPTEQREREKPGGSGSAPAETAAEVATVLAGMTYEERVRAYRSGAISTHELAIVAGRLPEEMPRLNDEYEWIAVSMADLD
jgi:hypothetical protein